jgi:hypothetical protein
MLKYIKIIFFIFKKLFLRSAHQKHKKINFFFKLNFLKTRIELRFQTLFKPPIKCFNPLNLWKKN